MFGALQSAFGEPALLPKGGDALRPLVSVVVNVIVVTFPERLICKVMTEHVSERLGSSERVEGI